MSLPPEIQLHIENAQKKTCRMPGLALTHALTLDRDLQALGFDYPVTYGARGYTVGATIHDSTAAPISSTESLSTLWRAEQLRRAGQNKQSAALAFENAQGAETAALNALFANFSTGHETLWLKLINKYLAHRALMAGQHKTRYQLTLRAGSDPVFFRLQPANTQKPTLSTDDPCVTVLMPIFNAQPTLALAAQSILDQTWQNLQLILIDDASTDQSLAIAHQIRQRDSRVRVLGLTQNGGPYIAKNIGVQNSTGRYITVHDADDWAFPTRLADQIKTLSEEPAANVAMGRMLRMQHDGLIRRIQPTGWITPDGATRLCFPSMIFERQYFENTLGAWDSAKAGADLELFHRIRRFDRKSLRINDQLVMLQLDSAGSLTVSDTLFNDERGISTWRQQYQRAWMRWHAESTELPKPPRPNL
jgi:hypothetical protein